jgi:tetratricopeptide (TPR) repeat protein
MELSRAGETTPSTRFDRALLLIEAKQFDEAESILASLEQKRYVFSPDNDRLPDPLYHLGRISLLRGDLEKAAEYMNQSLIRHPGEPAALAQLACLTNKETYADSLFSYFDEIDARFLLGRACLESGQYSRAADYLGRSVMLLPEHARGRILLAAALGSTGKYADAANLYVTTTGEHPGTVMLEEMIVPIFKKRAADGSAEALYWYGIVLRQYGRFNEALPYLVQAEKSGYAKAAEELRFLRNILLNRTAT